MRYEAVMKELKSLSDPEAVKGMARYGIKPEKALGISIPKLRKLAREIGKDHAMAQKLWASGIHEARILAGMIDDPEAVTEQQMESWACDFDSWDVCDQVCMNLFWLTPFAYDKCFEWSSRDEEFVKRAGFALMARLAWSHKEMDNSAFKKFLPFIRRESADERNFVKKSVNWALRQIGKRNLALNKAAIGAAKDIAKIDSSAARWIAADALRELKSDAVRERLSKAK